MNGADAISDHAINLPATFDHVSTRPAWPPPSIGAIPNAMFDAATLEKPPQSRSSSQRPSSENRTAASTATIIAAAVTVVSRTRRAWGAS
jgi:hypothetical protein